MDTAYRLYLGARNIGSRRFSDHDLSTVEAILNEHFHGWTTVKAVGRWQGKTEETLVITFTRQGVKPVASSAGAADAKASVERCVGRLKAHLGQEAVLLEEGGSIHVW